MFEIFFFFLQDYNFLEIEIKYGVLQVSWFILPYCKKTSVKWVPLLMPFEQQFINTEHLQ